MIKTPLLETVRLILRPIKQDDVEPIFSCWMKDENVSRYMFWKASDDIKEALSFVEFELANIENELWFRWIIEKTDTKEIIGTCLIYFNDDVGENHWDVSYNLGANYWGNGYITEAMKRVMKFAETTLDLDKCITTYAKVNTFSGKVLEKLGFKYVCEEPYIYCNNELETIGVRVRWTRLAEYKLFTEETKYVNYSHPSVQKKIREMFTDEMSDVDKVKVAYYFVRDEIKHSFDIGTNVVSVTASECLINKTGVCHVKANLLAALLRSQSIPTGFCFQHLAWDDTDPNKFPGYVIHGYNAVYLDGKWIKLDARGNKSNVHAEFSLDEPILAFHVNEEIGEYNVKGIFASPNITSMNYLEGLSELDPGNYADCNEVVEIPDVLE